jgi:rubrerythrin
MFGRKLGEDDEETASDAHAKRLTSLQLMYSLEPMWKCKKCQFACSGRSRPGLFWKAEKETTS